MGTYKPGVFGPFNGAVGDVVATKWKGLNVVKNFPAKSKKAPVLTQLEQRGKFSVVTRFLGRASNFISIGYKPVSGAVSPMNIAVRYHLKNAVTGSYPNYILDYTKVRLSKSIDMNLTLKPLATPAMEQTLKISWMIDTKASSGTQLTDHAYILIYNPAKESFLKSWDGVLRSDLSIDIPVPHEYVGDIVHSWIFFASKDGKFISDTSYLGAKTIIA